MYIVEDTVLLLYILPQTEKHNCYTATSTVGHSIQIPETSNQKYKWCVHIESQWKRNFRVLLQK